MSAGEPRDRTTTECNYAAALISLSASAFAQGAVVSPTSVFSKTLLLYVANCFFCDITLASKNLFSVNKWVEWTYNPLILLLYGLIRGLSKNRQNLHYFSCSGFSQRYSSCFSLKSAGRLKSFF